MPSPPAEPVSPVLERPIPARALGRLGPLLASGLGTAGIAGTAIDEYLREAVVAECVTCAMVVSGADLMTAALAEESTAELTDKQRRLRLGYCARNTCRSDYYTVRFRSVPGVDWAAVWEHAASGLQPPAASLDLASHGPSFTRQLLTLLHDRLRPLARPLPLTAMAILLLVGWLRSGGRVPGISPPRRVFIVPDGPAPPSAPTVRPPSIPR